MFLEHSLSNYLPKDNLLDKLIYISFLGIVITYPFTININSFLIISTTGLSILKFFKSKRILFSYLSILFLFFFLTRVASLLYTEDITSGGKIILRSMSLIAFPIIMMITHKTLPKKIVFIKVLFITTTIACLYCLLRNIFFFYDNEVAFGLWFDWSHNNHHLSRYLRFGPNYFSLLIVLNFIGTFFYRKKLNIIYGLGVIIQLIFMLLLSSRGLLSFFAVFLVISIMYIAFKRFRIIGLLFSLILLMSIFYGIYCSVPVLRQRYIKTYNELFVGDMKINKVGGIVTRKKKFDASIGIIKENPILGVGIGDVRNELGVQFKKQNFQEGVIKWYDAHNQYLESFMASGILGLLSLLSIFGYCFTYAFSNRDYYLITILILFIFYGLLESFMETHKGIVLASLIFTYFFYQNKNFNY